MTNEEAFALVNNLDVREPLRKYSPQWSMVAVDKSGEIVAVIRHKERPSISLNREHLKKYPGTAQISAWPGRFSSVEDLARAVDECVWANKNY